MHAGRRRLGLEAHILMLCCRLGVFSGGMRWHVFQLLLLPGVFIFLCVFPPSVWLVLPRVLLLLLNSVSFVSLGPVSAVPSGASFLFPGPVASCLVCSWGSSVG